MKVRLFEGTNSARAFENVTSVEFAGDTIIVESMFEEAQTLSGVVIERIDCLHHTVVLRRVNSPVQQGELV
jgi:predicted RNA-binding protein